MLRFRFIDVMDDANIGMVERGGRLGLALEAFEGLKVRGKLLREELEGDESVQLGVLSLIDYTHATTPELLENAIVGNGLAGHQHAP